MEKTESQASPKPEHNRLRNMRVKDIFLMWQQEIQTNKQMFDEHISQILEIDQEVTAMTQSSQFFFKTANKMGFDHNDVNTALNTVSEDVLRLQSKIEALEKATNRNAYFDRCDSETDFGQYEKLYL